MRARRTHLLMGALFLLGLGAGAGIVATLDGVRPSGVTQSAASEPRATDEEAFQPDDTTRGSCTTEELECLEQAWGNLAADKGAEIALRELASHTGTGDATDRNCHRLAHAVGAGSLHRHDGDVGPAFAEGDGTCASGYFHGVLEHAFAGVDESELERTAVTLCDSPEVQRSQFHHYQCVHGLGHGLMLHTGYDLPAALKICEGFAVQWEATSCDGGVFMENISASRGGVSRFLRDDDLIYPCNEVDERHKLYCYLMVTSRIGAANNFDWPDIARHCASKAEPDWRDECFQSYGRDASGHANGDFARLKQLCAVPAPRWQPDCIYGASRDVTNQDAAPRRAARYCALYSGALRTRCDEGIGTILRDLFATDAERVKSCRSAFDAPARLRDCSRGAGVAA